MHHVYSCLLHEFRYSAPGAPKADADRNARIDAAILSLEEIWPEATAKWRAMFS